MLAHLAPSFRRCLVAAAVVLFLCMDVSCLRLDAEAAAGPVFSPQPREFRPGVGLTPIRSAVVAVPGGNAQDLFAAQQLSKLLHGKRITANSSLDTVDVVVRLLRKGTPEADALLAAEHLVFTPAMHDEGYILVAHQRSVTVIADSAAGIFYGTQTLSQMLETSSGSPACWTGVIRDWPAMKYRGIHDDLSRGPFPTLAFLKHQMDVFAAHKINLYSPYFESNLVYSQDPLAAPPGGSLTRDEARELVAYASTLHILIVPEQEAFGHLHHLLQFEKYADIAETPHGTVLAPGELGTQPLIRSWFDQIADDFPGPFFHVGADETFDLGTGRTHGQVERKGPGVVYADFLTQIHATLQPLHRRLLFWGDVAGSSPDAIPLLPKDMIAIPWIYWHKDSYDGDILPFKKAGIETWVAPGDANWSVVYPLGGSAVDNISGFVATGQRLGSTGELTTVWNDDGEGLFNQDWYGVLFSAAAGWQPGTSDGTQFQNAFGRTFFGDTSGRINAAERELIAATDEFDVSDDAFWVDPWSDEGKSLGNHLRPLLKSARLHAERALELLELAKASEPDLVETDALMAMELGARRIDFIGLKFQLADEISAAYAKAYALRADKSRNTEVRELLFSITSTNGRCQDLRDGYSLIKALYRDSWLSENRPYWLDNVLVRYDLRVQLWEQRGEQLRTVIDRWQKTSQLPEPKDLGIPEQPSGS